MDKDHDIRKLFERYVNNSCTPEEAARFIRMLQSGKNRAYLEQLIEANLDSNGDDPVDDAVLARVLTKLNLGDNYGTRTKSLSIYIKTAAAMVLAALVAGTWFYLDKGTKTKEQRLATDVPPGGNRATLTLADGRTVELSTAHAGIVVGDEITYNNGSKVLSEQGSDSQLHTLTTPKGGTYQITLSDGTKVWLNAESTLKYPSRFNGGERTVELEGEAYFEVTGSQKVSFKVVSNGQVVEVLGTHFNINAYSNETTTNTTLLEGAVKVVTNGATTLLKPGEQSRVGIQGISVADVDVQTIVDWKNGDFIFLDEPLTSIMRKVTRWYGVKVVYEHDLPNDRYSAQISRSKNLSEVLRILELSGGLSFKIENNTLFLSSPK